MKHATYIIILLSILAVGCNSGKENKALPTMEVSEVQIAGAMKNVMKEGKLQGILHLDSIETKEGLYGLGPAENLQGELLILNGRSYISRVSSDSTMEVQETFEASAPFFVYANESRWKATMLPDSIASMKELESLLDQKTSMLKKPFVFKLTGIVEEAEIHVQNLPDSTKVTSHTEAHIGRQDFKIRNKEVSIIGFFSREHQGIFTHKDSFLHMHLITKDKTQMGHLDQVNFGSMKLYLPMGAEDEANLRPQM